MREQHRKLPSRFRRNGTEPKKNRGYYCSECGDKFTWYRFKRDLEEHMVLHTEKSPEYLQKVGEI